MHSITSQQIEIFLAVANCGNITAAAKQLFMSQPTVSIWLGKMEESLGIQLFERKNRGVELTTEGERLYAELDPIYNRYRISLNRVLCGERSSKKPKLSVGCLRQIDIIKIMHEACYRFQLSHPDVFLTHEVFCYHECREKLLCGELDVMFTLSFEVEDEFCFSSARISDVKQFFIVPHSWHMNEKRTLDYSGLNNRTLLLEVNQGNKIFGSICGLYEIIPNIKYVDTTLLLLHEVAEGEGFTISAKNIPLNRKDIFDFIPIPKLPPELRIDSVVAWREGDRTQLIRDFVCICDDIRDEHNA